MIPRTRGDADVGDVVPRSDGSHERLRPVASGHIEFNIQNKFPAWKKAKIQVLTPSDQKGLLVTKTGDRLDLK